MKTLNIHLSILIMTLVLSLNSFGADNGNCGTVKSNVLKEIQANMHVNIEKSARVEVVFTTDSLGKVNLAIAKTDNAELKKAIESNFMKLSLSSLVPDNCYSIVINLRVV